MIRETRKHQMWSGEPNFSFRSGHPKSRWLLDPSYPLALHKGIDQELPWGTVDPSYPERFVPSRAYEIHRKLGAAPFPGFGGKNSTGNEMTTRNWCAGRDKNVHLFFACIFRTLNVAKKLRKNNRSSSKELMTVRRWSCMNDKCHGLFLNDGYVTFFEHGRARYF